MRTKRQKSEDRIDAARIRAIIKTYGGNADKIAHYVDQCLDRLHDGSYRNDLSDAEFRQSGREYDNAVSALAIVEER